MHNGMYIGIDSFRNTIEKSKKLGKWVAWKENYYSEYKDVFDAQLFYLYMFEIDDLKPLIESSDFDTLLQTASRYYESNPFQRMKSLIERSAHLLSFTDEFSTYFLVGLGHIDGTALPYKNPILYFGLERLPYANLDILVPHEMNHLVRFATLKNEFPPGERFTIKQLVVAEGLATIFPLILHGKSLSEEHVKKALMITDNDYSKLQHHKEKIINEIFNVWDNVITQQTMEQYFMVNNNTEYKKAGYYVGALIIMELLAQGFKIEDLTKMKTDVMIAKYIEGG